jgi:hypothetical protein
MHYKADKQKQQSNASLLDNPLAVLGIALLSVAVLFVLLELINNKSIYRQKSIPESEKEDSSSSVAKKDKPNSSSDEKKIENIKKRIEGAEDKKHLELILTELEADSLAIVKLTSESDFQNLKDAISSKKIKLERSKEKSEPNVKEEPIAELPASYNQMLKSINFDLSLATSMKNQYNGYDRSIIDALDYYKKISEHKANYVNIMSELKKLGDNSYYENAEKLMRKKFKNKSIDEFEEEDEYLLNNRPAWLSAPQLNEIRRWGDEIDDELERIDSDY